MIVTITDWCEDWFFVAYGDLICVGVMLGEDGEMYRAFESLREE